MRMRTKPAVLTIDIVTLFPSFFKGPLKESILKRAQQRGILKIRVHDLRDHTYDRHKTADDKPFGGGPGMVMKPEPIFECVESLKAKSKPEERPWTVLLEAKGERLTQSLAAELARKQRLILIAGHYEGVDGRVGDFLADQILSIGDFVTMGGEAPALCVIEAVGRLVPGVLGNKDSLEQERFLSAGLEYPQYTRPRDYRGMKVPDVLVSGNHKEVLKWREGQSRKMIRDRRPDLLEKESGGKKRF